MKVGAFVCSCGGALDTDLKGVRDGVSDVDVVASASVLCEDGLPAMAQVIDEYELDQLIITAPEPRCQDVFRTLVSERDLHPDAASFVNHREFAAWVHEPASAAAKTARLIEARSAGLRAESVSRSVSRDAGDSVVVVGDPKAASDLAEVADVALIADGEEFVDESADLDGVSVERGRVVAVDGRYADFEVTVQSRVTDDCIGCMKCVREGPNGAVTRHPIDIAPDAPDGSWTECCPTDAIDLDGVERVVTADQVVYPGADARARGGTLGLYTDPVDAATAAEIERLTGGVTKPEHLDIEMDVCAAGASSQIGCNACVDACPHDAVDRPTVDEVEFDPVACQGCGACTSACPTGAVQFREPSNERIAREVEAMVEPPDSGGWLFGRDDPIETQVIAFVCSERAQAALEDYGRRAVTGTDGVAYPPLLPVSVPCADTIGEAHVMHALAVGADGVAIVGCGGECRHAGPDPKAALVERLNRACEDLGLGTRIEFFSPEPGDPKPFVEEASRFVEVTLDESPVPAGDHEATGGAADRPNPDFDSHGWTLESVRAILDHVEPTADVIRGLKDFGRLSVSEACTLTPTCSNLCPADALRRDGPTLQFNHERCVNCGLCAEGCPESAIAVDGGLDLSLLPENRDGDDPAWVTVHEGEMLECVRCGTPFTSAATADKIEAEVGDLVGSIAPDAEHSVFEYCGDCRAKLLFENR